jgi:hypothetical protein
VFPKSLRKVDGSSLVDLETVSIEAGNTAFVLEADLLYDATLTVIVRNFSSEPSMVIGKRVHVVAKHAFTECKSITDIRFEPESTLHTIESYAFTTASVHSVSIPRFVEVLRSFAFSDCRFLECVTFDDESNLMIIEEFAFLSCLVLEQVELPPSVEFVELSAFPDYCNVKILGSSIFDCETDRVPRRMRRETSRSRLDTDGRRRCAASVSVYFRAAGTANPFSTSDGQAHTASHVCGFNLGVLKELETSRSGERLQDQGTVRQTVSKSSLEWEAILAGPGPPKGVATRRKIQVK